MLNKYELDMCELNNKCQEDKLDFNSTEDLQPLHEIIGQERAVESMRFGVKMQNDGYNIYMSGTPGQGKTTYATSLSNEIAKAMSVPDDWCYVYNFHKPNAPIALNLPAGKGKEFKNDMEDFIKILEQEIVQALDGDEYEAERSRILKTYKDKKREYMDELKEKAYVDGFEVKTISTGVYFLPIYEDRTLSEEEFAELPDKAKREITLKSDKLQEDSLDIIKKLREIEYDALEHIEKWEQAIALTAVGLHIDAIKEKYMDYTGIVRYLIAVEKDILANLNEIKLDSQQDENSQEAMPIFKKTEDSPKSRYIVNLVIDNSNLSMAPVIVDYNPTYYNLIGRFEYDNEFGTMSTNYTKIKGGLLHQANGGILIVQMNDLISSPNSWETLKRALKSKQIRIENMKEQMGVMPVSYLRPEPIPLSIKIIVIGSPQLYSLLYQADRDFKKLFKIKSDFDYEMKNSTENVNMLAKFIAKICVNDGLPHIDKSGVSEVINFCVKSVEDKDKITTRYNLVADIVLEAAEWKKEAGDKACKYITAEHVKKAIKKKIYRSAKPNDQLLEMFDTNMILIDTLGSEIGQINGLSIIDTGDFKFGKPARITATTHVGNDRIVNIEREVDISGSSHSKGVLILSGYLGQKYAQEIPLCLSAKICFEQLYSGVDGDSATAAEIYTLMSSLSEVPIKQSIAITGSMNQRGLIQPIGGVNCKIESFYKICKNNGLTGEQGVIIPKSNVRNLVLDDEVIEAVENGDFHIYAIEKVEEGIEILTGVPAGEKNEKGHYEEGTINDLITKKLEKYAQIVTKYK